MDKNYDVKWSWESQWNIKQQSRVKFANSFFNLRLNLDVNFNLHQQILN